MTQHETLMALADAYVGEYPNDTCGAKEKAALSDALLKVVQELEAAKAALRKHIRVYQVDDQAWNPEDEADRLTDAAIDAAMKGEQK